jgi:hypothetical protein
VTTTKDIAAIHTALRIIEPTPANYRLAVRRILEGKIGVDMATDGMVDVVLDELEKYRAGLEDGAAGKDDD